MDKTTESQEVGAFFDAYAEGFDSIYGHTARRGPLGRWLDRRFRGSMYRRFQDTLDNVADPGLESVLDIGCGSGRYCVEFLRQGKQVTGIDVAPNMLELARALCAREVPEREAVWIQADYLTHEFDAPHDVAVLMGLFDYVGDARAVLEKVRRDAAELMLASFPKPAGLLTWQRKIRYRLRGCPLYFYARGDVEELLDSTGYEGYRITEYDRDFFVRAPI